MARARCSQRSTENPRLRIKWRFRKRSLGQRWLGPVTKLEAFRDKPPEPQATGKNQAGVSQKIVKGEEARTQFKATKLKSDEDRKLATRNGTQVQSTKHQKQGTKIAPK